MWAMMWFIIMDGERIIDRLEEWWVAPEITGATTFYGDRYSSIGIIRMLEEMAR